VQLALAEHGAGEGDRFEQLDAPLLELRPEALEPAGLEAGEQTPVGDGEPGPRVLPPRRVIAASV
jgi:hypothetical protein